MAANTSTDIVAAFSLLWTLRTEENGSDIVTGTVAEWFDSAAGAACKFSRFTLLGLRSKPIFWLDSKTQSAELS